MFGRNSKKPDRSQRIYFENDYKPKSNWILAFTTTLVTLAAVYKPFKEIPDFIYGITLLSCITLSILSNASYLRYKNHVYYSDGKITIHLNSFFGKTIPFIKIKSYSFSPEYLDIEFKDGSLTYFSLKNIHPEDVKRLEEIFVSK